MNALQKELDAMRKRDNELSVLFKRLYEDHVLQRITAEQFRMLSADYNTEQKGLQEAIPEKAARLERLPKYGLTAGSNCLHRLLFF